MCKETFTYTYVTCVVFPHDHGVKTMYLKHTKVHVCGKSACAYIMINTHVIHARSVYVCKLWLLHTVVRLDYMVTLTT